jgi:uncharacterized protein YndB with AHSA1/START domain
VTDAREADAVEREIRIHASPQTVFAFLTDPAKMVRWMGTEASLEPHRGGTYRVNVTGRECVRGQVVEIVPDTRLVFTWGWEDGMFPVPPGASTVEISLEPDGDGTLLRLTHRDLPADMRRFHALGWRHSLSRLAVAAAGGDPGVDPLTSTMRAARITGRGLPRRYLYRFPIRRLASRLQATRPSGQAAGR